MSTPALHAWLFCAIASVPLALLAWLIGSGMHRVLRLSHAAAGYWIGVWTLAWLPAALALLVLALPAPWQPASDAWPTATLPLPTALTVEPGPAASHWDLLADNWPLAITAVYLGGFGWSLWRWGRSALGLRRLRRASSSLYSERLPGAQCKAQVRRLARSGITLRVTQQPTSPFALRWPRPTILLPAALLQALDDHSLYLVLRHEAAHLARHDPQRATAMRVIQTLLWFNPFLHRIAGRVQAAAELACDAAALAPASIQARRGYAEAYLATLRLSAGQGLAASASAFSGRDPGGHRLRLSQMLQGDRRRRLHPLLGFALGAAALASGSALALVQARSLAPVPPAPVAQAAALPASPSTPAPAAPHFGYPVAQPRVTSPFGNTRPPYVRPHRGLDFAARRGTPVLAPADGIVSTATTQYPGGAQYGSVVVLDHGNGWQSLYAHLDSFDVHTGQTLRAGTRIGRAGRTGKVTGAHLHLEILHSGKRIDPAPLLH